jgi:hypothetical protein
MVKYGVSQIGMFFNWLKQTQGTKRSFVPYDEENKAASETTSCVDHTSVKSNTISRLTKTDERREGFNDVFCAC